MGYDRLLAVYPEYRQLMLDAGYRGVVMVPPSDGEDGCIRLDARFGEQCGVVGVRVEVRCAGDGPFDVTCAITRSSIGNAGWNGGTRCAALDTARRLSGFALEYLGRARRLLD